MMNSKSWRYDRPLPRIKTAARLPEPLSARLNAYALAAGAAGVSVLACAAPAEGAPVCRTHVTDLPHTTTFPLYLINPAVAPFNVAQATNSTFRSFTTTGLGSLFWWNRGFFEPNSGGARVLLSKGLPADLASGAEIGPSADFGKPVSYGLLFTYGRGHYRSGHGGGTTIKHRGNLNFSQDNFIGFQFTASGAVHYGWARLSVSFVNSDRKAKHTVLHIKSYGYESSPNMAIAAGSCGVETKQEKPDVTPPKASSTSSAETSLGLLALGSNGLGESR